jgi:hypothetical protein
MGSWYTIGILVGLGTSLGVAAAAIGFAFWEWQQVAGGVAGALCGALGSAPLVAGALRRGGTRGGTATLLGLASLVGAALAFVPVVGYLEALAVPLLGARARRREPERHAGLRSLARD